MADETLPTSKVCSKCGETKPLNGFVPRADGRFGRMGHCRACDNLIQKARREANPDKNAAYIRAARQRDPERYREYDRRNQERNRGAGSDYEKRRYARRDKEQAQQALRKWKAENPEKQRAIETARNERIKAQKEADPEFRKTQNKRVGDWRNNKRATDPDFREKVNSATRQWHRENRDYVNAYKRKLNAERRKSDPVFRIKCALRSRLRLVRKGQPSSAAFKMLGCSVEEFRSHIEGQFRDGMTWENWGRGWGGAREWHLDHIKALATFNLTDPAQVAKACHYTNLQPLWASENLSKGVGEWREVLL